MSPSILLFIIAVLFGYASLPFGRFDFVLFKSCSWFQVEEKLYFYFIILVGHCLHKHDLSGCCAELKSYPAI